MKSKFVIPILILVILFCVVFCVWYFYRSRVATPVIISESIAIETIKDKFPEFKEYPSDKLAPKSIKTEKAEDGWYVAFIQEGSGVLIIDAKCFLINNDKSITQIKYTSQDNNIVGEFSAEECKVVANVVGGDRDEHGCIGSAGYSWCQEKQKCLRIWEEPCNGNNNDSICEIENCHGLEITCGSNPPDVCTEIYEVGDKCLQYAKCEIQDGQCIQAEDSRFTECKLCVQTCIDTNKNDNIALFECESNCN